MWSGETHSETAERQQKIAYQMCLSEMWTDGYQIKLSQCLSVCLSVTILKTVLWLSNFRLSVTGICNRQIGGKLQEGTELTY